MVLFGITLFGCSSNRVSVSIPVETIQDRMALSTMLEETHDNFFISKALFDDLEAGAAKVSDNSNRCSGNLRNASLQMKRKLLH
jgi:hypothetical protein